MQIPVAGSLIFLYCYNVFIILILIAIFCCKTYPWPSLLMSLPLILLFMECILARCMTADCCASIDPHVARGFPAPVQYPFQGARIKNDLCFVVCVAAALLGMAHPNMDLNSEATMMLA